MGNGKFNFSFTPTVSGMYFAQANLGLSSVCMGVCVPECPGSTPPSSPTYSFAMDVMPALASPLKSSASGNGLTSGVAGEASEFMVVVRDQFGNQKRDGAGYYVSAMFTDTLLASVMPMLKPLVDNNDGTFTGQFIPTKIATANGGVYALSINVTVNGNSAAIGTGEMFTVEVIPGAVSPGDSTLAAGNVYRSVAGEQHQLSVQAKDAYGNSRVSSDGRFYVKLVQDATGVAAPTASVTYSGSGTFVASYVPTVADTYKIQVQGDAQVVMAEGTNYSVAMCPSGTVVIMGWAVVLNTFSNQLTVPKFKACTVGVASCDMTGVLGLPGTLPQVRTQGVEFIKSSTTPLAPASLHLPLL